MTNPFKTRKTASVTEIKTNTVSENFSSERLVGMTFKMPHSWHTEFKMRAVQEGISMHELLFRSYDAYKKEQGG